MFTVGLLIVFVLFIAKFYYDYNIFKYQRIWLNLKVLKEILYKKTQEEIEKLEKNDIDKIYKKVFEEVEKKEKHK